MKLELCEILHCSLREVDEDYDIRLFTKLASISKVRSQIAQRKNRDS